MRNKSVYIITNNKSCESFFIMKLTNVVVGGQLDTVINLCALARQLTNVRYDPTSFSGLIWQHRKIGGNCLIFANGYINCNGSCESFRGGIKRLRRYARLLQKLGYCHTLTDVKIITASASHRLDGKVKLEHIPFKYRYEPELFPAIMFKREDIHFTLHFSGALIITGIKKPEDIDDVIYPVILELAVSL